jgi:hypothetical protein
VGGADREPQARVSTDHPLLLVQLANEVDHDIIGDHIHVIQPVHARRTRSLTSTIRVSSHATLWSPIGSGSTGTMSDRERTVGIAGPRTFFAYGSSDVDVTTDRGRTWWGTYVGEYVAAVVPSYRNELVAYVEQSVSSQHLNPAVTWQYVSRDGGRQWRYNTEFAGIPG